ncbi:MAG: glycosyltransferase family 2 protein [Candidatus Dependentiae bacterium]|nr:glycosyltransferase family 2 protein [Candidatus Dependentiae bacterium]
MNKRLIRAALFVLVAMAPVTHAAEAFCNEPDQNGERRIVVITASYNNKDWYQANLDSIFAQNYTNYRVIYIDDCSPDGTGDLVEQYIKENGQEHRVTLVKNKKHCGAMANHYNAITTCDDRDIIVIVDGDDCVARQGVFNYLNNVYADNSIWLTYGQFVEFPSGCHGFCCPMPRHVIERNAFRDFEHIPSHMRTFYAGLFKQIKKEDLMYQGEFLKMDADIAAMFPMIEMARDHFRFIPEVLYAYNGGNALNDHKISKSMQRQLDLMLRAKPRYNKAKSPIREQGA